MQVNWNALPRFTAPRRFGWRVWFLPLFLWPLMLDLPIEILTGDGDGVMAAALGLGLSWIGGLAAGARPGRRQPARRHPDGRGRWADREARCRHGAAAGSGPGRRRLSRHAPAD
jgi:hypothetical protein